MPIKASITLENGVILPEGFIKVEKTTIYENKISLETGGTIDNFTAEALINIYASQQAYKESKPPVVSYNEIFIYDIEKVNIISQAENAVKSNSTLMLSNVTDV